MNAENNNNQNKQDTITFQPTVHNRRKLDEVMGVRRLKNGDVRGRKPRRGDQSKILNEALNKYLPIILQEKKAQAESNQQTA